MDGKVVGEGGGGVGASVGLRIRVVGEVEAAGVWTEGGSGVGGHGEGEVAIGVGEVGVGRGGEVGGGVDEVIDAVWAGAAVAGAGYEGASVGSGEVGEGGWSLEVDKVVGGEGGVEDGAHHGVVVVAGPGPGRLVVEHHVVLLGSDDGREHVLEGGHGVVVRKGRLEKLGAAIERSGRLVEVLVLLSRAARGRSAVVHWGREHGVCLRAQARFDRKPVVADAVFLVLLAVVYDEEREGERCI